MSGVLNLRYRPAPSAKTLLRLYENRGALIEAVMGPFGAGKTMGCLAKLLALALEQKPDPRDGVRRTKFAVIRDTYPNLRSTTMRSWFELVPQTVGRFVGESPAYHEITLEHPQLGRIETRFEFIALGNDRVEDVMRGWEGSGAYLNEADLLPPSVREYVQGRVLRYPARQYGGPTNPLVLMDFNAPDVDSYLYELFVENVREPVEVDGRSWRISFFRQPSGFSPEAENIEFLAQGYYQLTAMGQPDWWVRRFVENEWGYSRDGQPVYPEYSDKANVAAEPLEPLIGPEILIGADAGRTPAAVIGQETADGQLRICAELVAESMSARPFAKEINRLLAKPAYRAALEEAGDRRRGVIGARGWGDPSADYAGDQTETTWLQILSEETGIRFRPSPCKNDLAIRLEEVRQRLVQPLDADRRGLVIGPNLRILRKGFNSGYRYRRMQMKGERFEDKPDKNEFSHVHDALQYLAAGIGHRGAVYGRKRDRYSNLGQTRAQDGESHAGGLGQAYAITD